MNSINVKSIKKEMRNEKQRRISIPKGKYADHMVNPYQQKYDNGEFKNQFYQQYSALFIAGIFIKNIMMFLIPALILHAPLLLIKTVHLITFGVPMYIEVEPTYLAIIYGVPALLAASRIKNIMAYYNVMAINGRANINSLQSHSMNVHTPNAIRELAVMDHTRMKLNKVHLFQTATEAAIDKQEHGEFADTVENKTSEHFAAKAIADRKQKETGGANEYDKMVRRFKSRTTPAMRKIIKMVQN